MYHCIDLYRHLASISKTKFKCMRQGSLMNWMYIEEHLSNFGFINFKLNSRLKQD